MSKGDGLGMPAKAEEIKTEPEGRVICYEQNIINEDTFKAKKEKLLSYI